MNKKKDDVNAAAVLFDGEVQPRIVAMISDEGYLFPARRRMETYLF